MQCDLAQALRLCVARKNIPVDFTDDDDDDDDVHPDETAHRDYFVLT